MVSCASPREELAFRYVRGAGIEFGALHCPLPVSEDVSVKYADVHPVETLQNLFPDIAGIKAPDIITDLESMRGVDNDSQDFVIANHVLEHVEDPLKALKSIGRVLRRSGIAFLAIPDKRFTFDKDRAITRLDHVLLDHKFGPDRSRRAHYEEWCHSVDRLAGEECAHKVALMLKEGTNIHFHVWDYAAMLELFSHVAQDCEINLEVVTSAVNGNEVVWVLRKSGTDVPRLTKIGAAQAFQAAAHCPLCDAANTQLARADCGESCSTRICEACGFAFVWPRIEQDFSDLPADAYYGNWELLDLDSIAGLYADVIAARSRLCGAARFFGERPAILDVGCGAGHVLLNFRAAGWMVQGIDPWSAVSEIGRKYYRLPIETARIENAASVIPSSQDVTLSIDVLNSPLIR